MSDQQPPQPAPRRRIHPLVALMMFVIGAVLLLPGLCSLFFGAVMVINLARSRADFTTPLAGILQLWLLGMFLGAVGVGLIVLAIRR